MKHQILNLSQGKISYLELGAPVGETCIYFHGVPGSSRQILVMQDHGVLSRHRVIAYDRPGMGESTISPRRRLTDSAEMVRGLADHLGADKFHLIAVSGGTPHAFVAADKMRDRVLSLTAVGGLGPLHEPEFMRCFSRFGQRTLRLARWSPRALAMILNRIENQIQTQKVPDEARLRKWLPEPDVQIVMNPKYREVFRASMRHSFLQGGLGVALEMRVFQQDWQIRDWSFPFPVRLWHGLKDGVVPPLHSRMLAKRIPGAELHEWPDEAHYSLPILRLAEVLKPILA